MRRKLAFVTDTSHGNFAEDDRLLVQFLQDQNHTVIPTAWDDSSIDWLSFDNIIFRSPWDYFLKIDAFTEWLNHLDNLKLKVFNPIPVLQWNKDKNYLLRFKALGVDIPDFQYCETGGRYDLKDILNNHRWNKAVIKPSISGGAYKTWVTDLTMAAEHQAIFNELIRHRAVIIQKFSDEINIYGEVSLIYFNKKFSHAVCKKTKEGEFRVQAQYGGKHQPFTASHNLLGQADKILNLITEPLLYARVDGYLNEQGKFFLMELELLEPVLFFDSDPDACTRFYNAFREMTYE